MKLPRITAPQRKKLSPGLHDLINHVILPILQDAIPREETDEEWSHFEAAIRKVTHVMQKYITRSLGISSHRTSPGGPSVRRVSREDEASHFSLDLQVRNWQSLAGRIRQLCELVRGDNPEDAPNVISRLESEILGLIPRLPREEVERVLGSADIGGVRAFVRKVTEEEQNTKLDWGYHRLLSKEEEFRNRKTSERKRREKLLYQEDASRAYRWLVSDSSPENPNRVEDFEGTYGERWATNPRFTPHGVESAWHVTTTLEDRVREEIEESLIDIEKIEGVITTRGNLSSAGEDGIPPAFFKLAPKGFAEATRLVIVQMLRFRRCPNLWKCSKTIFLHKGQDPHNTANWRPISITPAWYRIITAHFARVLTTTNEVHPFITPAQKGFRQGVDGCCEHAMKLNELIADAARRRRGIYLATIDLRDAFGSVPHELFCSVMRQIGIPESLVGTVEDIYKGASATLTVRNASSNPINIRRGVKQGCPLSPVLFNLCLEPLIRYIEHSMGSMGYGLELDDDGGTDVTSIQAFADDIVLVASHPEGLQQLLDTTQVFCDDNCLTVAPSKCKILYLHYDGSRQVNVEGTFAIGGEELESTSMGDFVKYLGAPIAVRKNSRLKFAGPLVEDIRGQLSRIKSSGLTLSQKLHAIRVHLIPQMDYLMRLGQVPFKDLKRLDREIRGVVNECLIGSPIPIPACYMDWHDGGLGLPNLRKRQYLLQMTTFASLINSPHQSTVTWANQVMRNEIRFRGISINDEGGSEEGEFLGWQTTDGSMAETRYGRNTFATRAWQASRRLQIGLRLSAEGFAVKDLINASGPRIVSHSGLAKAIRAILYGRWNRKIDDMGLRGHSFQSLRENPLASFFVVNHKVPVSDAITRFAIAARTNSLPTGETLHHDQNRDHVARCPLCTSNPALDSLAHRLNRCPSKFALYTRRHNLVVETILAAVQDVLTPAPIFYRNTPVVINGTPVSERCRNLRPDAWYLDGQGNLTIIEVTIPYASTSDHNPSGIPEDTMESRYEEKKAKYAPLVNDATQTFGIQVNLFVFVISSLGAPHKTFAANILRMLSCTKPKAEYWTRRAVIQALYGSFSIYRNLDFSVDVQNTVPVLRGRRRPQRAPNAPTARPPHTPPLPHTASPQPQSPLTSPQPEFVEWSPSSESPSSSSEESPPVTTSDEEERLRIRRQRRRWTGTRNRNATPQSDSDSGSGSGSELESSTQRRQRRRAPAQPQSQSPPPAPRDSPPRPRHQGNTGTAGRARGRQVTEEAPQRPPPSRRRAQQSSPSSQSASQSPQSSPPRRPSGRPRQSMNKKAARRGPARAGSRKPSSHAGGTDSQ